MLMKITNINKTFALLFLFIVVLPISLKYLYYKLTEFEKVIYIKDKFKNDLSLFDNGLLFIKDDIDETYNVTNLFFKWDFNKEADYKKLEKNNKYLVKGYGLKLKYSPFYRNIYEVEKKVD